MAIYIKGMEMPKGCYDCPLLDGEYGDCKVGATGLYDPYRDDCPLTEVLEPIRHLPSAEAVSREEYEETDGVIEIKKQSAKDVGEIKHIVIRSPNYTRYFYNESMPTSAEAVQGEWTNEKGKPITDKFSVYCSRCKEWSEYRTNYCGHCGAKMKGGEEK